MYYVLCTTTTTTNNNTNTTTTNNHSGHSNNNYNTNNYNSRKFRDGSSLRIHQRGVQWKQSVVIYMMLCNRVPCFAACCAKCTHVATCCHIWP